MPKTTAAQTLHTNLIGAKVLICDALWMRGNPEIPDYYLGREGEIVSAYMEVCEDGTSQPAYSVRILNKLKDPLPNTSSVMHCPVWRTVYTDWFEVTQMKRD